MGQVEGAAFRKGGWGQALCSSPSAHPLWASWVSFPFPAVKQVFKDLEFLGWYTTGGPPDQSDIHVHKQVSPLFSSFPGCRGTVPVPLIPAVGNVARGHRCSFLTSFGFFCTVPREKKEVFSHHSDTFFSPQVCEIIESPLFLKLNPMTKHTDVSTCLPSLKYHPSPTALCPDEMHGL